LLDTWRSRGRNDDDVACNALRGNAGDGLLLRGSFTADSTSDSFVVGEVPDVTGRTYFADKVVIKVSTAFSGGSLHHIVIKDGDGVVLVAEPDADITATGTYVVELDGETALEKGADITVEFLQVDGTTASVPTAGSVIVSVHYKWL
jgi:hypothetical protein